MSWIEVRATVPPADDLSPFVDIFREHGIENTQEELGPVLVGCFVDVEGVSERVAALSGALVAAGAIEVISHPLEEQNWDEVWKQFFKPRRVGKKFVVRPTWEEFESEAGDMVIVLDPGLAFGTGDHPTTRMCLELLEQADVAEKKVADVGCGSGILSIGAIMLGAAVVDAVDVDPESVEVSKENAELNGVDFRVILGEGVRSLYEETTDAATRVAAQEEWEQDEHPLAERKAASGVPTSGPVQIEPIYDVVLSNIISAVLIRIAGDVAQAVKPGGEWVVSGIIQGNWPDVLAAADKAGFELVEELEEGDWVAARFRRAA